MLVERKYILEALVNHVGHGPRVGHGDGVDDGGDGDDGVDPPHTVGVIRNNIGQVIKRTNPVKLYFRGSIDAQ